MGITVDLIRSVVSVRSESNIFFGVCVYGQIYSPYDATHKCQRTGSQNKIGTEGTKTTLKRAISHFAFLSMFVIS